MSGLLITGTDTSVGKTWVACHLARSLREVGLRVGVMKPCETGIQGGPRPTVLPPGSDADLLAKAAGCEAPTADMLPYAFQLPAAPSIAALEEGQVIDPAVLEASFGRLNEAHDVVIVEGAGGLLVPLAPDLDFLQLANQLDLSVLVVARTSLGTVNHVALTERALLAAACPLLGIVLNSPMKQASGRERVNLGALAQVVRSPVLAEMPHGSSPSEHVMQPLVDAVRRDLQVQPDGGTVVNR